MKTCAGAVKTDAGWVKTRAGTVKARAGSVVTLSGGVGTEGFTWKRAKGVKGGKALGEGLWNTRGINGSENARVSASPRVPASIVGAPHPGAPQTNWILGSTPA